MKNILCIGLIAAAFSCNTVTSQVLLDVAEFKLQMESTPDEILLDVRTIEEYQTGHLENSINLDFNGIGFAEKAGKLDKSKPIYVYCAAGGRSAKAANLLLGLGFTQVYDMKGGIGSWQSKGLPVVQY